VGRGPQLWGGGDSRRLGLAHLSVSVIYMCMFIHSNSRGLFSSKQCNRRNNRDEGLQ
jgi:hypothetical protein